MRLLLISNSTGPDGRYLGWCSDAISRFVGDAGPILFVPFAGIDEEAYGATAVDRLAQLGLTARWADRTADPLGALEEARVVFVGGGNTFLLLDRLAATGMLGAIRERVCAGLPYIGTSAGSNVAGPTIKTTNDMPIVEPPSFAALGLVPFQINPHYVDRDPDSSHQGETREQRLIEFLSQNETPVIALREGSMLSVADGEVTVGGHAGARVYRRDLEVLEMTPGSRLDTLAGMPGGRSACAPGHS